MKTRTCKLVIVAAIALLRGGIARARGKRSDRGREGRSTVMFTYREAEPDSWRPLFEEASHLLYNATNGQLQLGRFAWSNWPRKVATPTSGCSTTTAGAFANVLGLGGPGHIYISQTHKSVAGPAVGPFGLVHEFGHYGFGLYDEYKAAPPPGFNRSVEQTVAQPAPPVLHGGRRLRRVRHGRRHHHPAEQHPDGVLHVDHRTPSTTATTAARSSTANSTRTRSRR